MLNSPAIPEKTHGLSEVVDVSDSGAGLTGYDYRRKGAAAQQVSLVKEPLQKPAAMIVIYCLVGWIGAQGLGGCSS